ncbi:hypothetical protein BQ8794_180008 [Mesorhizobium prunaredense]|uniref:Uncharacterized protein n=1 Tax=Mesorhizobium prunaredense TaxID=1631249 RepID=A0A1R3V428_9HYPH|nr:hypothetical protein BQ8794_180008 [Mesorhizobium prunaredense]
MVEVEEQALSFKSWLRLEDSRYRSASACRAQCRVSCPAFQLLASSNHPLIFVSVEERGDAVGEGVLILSHSCVPEWRRLCSKPDTMTPLFPLMARRQTHGSPSCWQVFGGTRIAWDRVKTGSGQAVATISKSERRNKGQTLGSSSCE